MKFINIYTNNFNVIYLSIGLYFALKALVTDFALINEFLVIEYESANLPVFSVFSSFPLVKNNLRGFIFNIKMF